MVVSIILGILICFLWIASIVKEVRNYHRQVPYGKVFIRDFSDTVYDIHRAQNIAKVPQFVVFIKNKSFKVRVERDESQIGLEYPSIPMYSNFCVYINDEIVCRIHQIHSLKDYKYIEFSSKRNRDEIIAIINEAYKPSKEEIDYHYNRLFNKSKSSFYAETEETD